MIGHLPFADWLQVNQYCWGWRTNVSNLRTRCRLNPGMWIWMPLRHLCALPVSGNHITDISK
jgi:hypothetical protein